MSQRTMLSLILLLPVLFLAFGIYEKNKHVDVPMPSTHVIKQPLQTISTKDISLTFDSDAFGLATTREQVLVKSYIPPCDDDFDYCIYYVGTEFSNTNFESAGIRLTKRNDISNETDCLTSPPRGYTSHVEPAKKQSKDTYATSYFNNLGDAGAGHYARGELFRVFVKENQHCYEFETRIGQTQFQNYPAGSINEFTEKDFQMIQNELLDVLKSTTLRSGERVVF